ncbi:MAG: sulfite exporter TauE/SafE family protein [Chloroflexi bacterium]|nr:sulfite exporter TauE/SafE family protein [Chloroflexota bacterium]
MDHSGVHLHANPLLPAATSDWTGVALLLLVLAGLASSLHCVGMCGGFAIAASRARLTRRFGLSGTVLYTVGRLTSYTTVGAIAGAIGQSLWVVAALAGLQSAVAIVAGVALSIAGLRLLGLRTGGNADADPLTRLFVALSAPLRGLVPPAGPGQAWLLGVLNGLLPCPVVYAFVPAAVAAGSPSAGAAVLGAVGLGTIPAMALAGALATIFERWRRQAAAPFQGRVPTAPLPAPWRHLLPWAGRLPGVLAIAIGAFLVGRGALGIG